MAENTHNFYMPKTNLVGVGAIKDLPDEIKHLKLKKVLIVTDKNIISLGYVEMVERVLKSLFISYDIFDGVIHSNPTVSFVEDGLKYFPNKLNVLARDYDYLISIGGGTNHDCAKAIATVATNGGSITDYEGWKKITKPMIPVICINTTSGSGAEVTMFAVITDNSRKVKMLMGSPNMMPIMSVNDPMFMASMPKELTAGVGFDVITQAIESFLCTEASPITDGLALHALKIAIEYLPRAYENGNDLEAREKMMFASMMAGMTLNNAGLGYVHSMAHQLGGFYNEYHGNYDAILLPFVLEYNAVSIPDERMIKIAEAMHIKADKKSQALDKIIASLLKMRYDFKMPDGLSEMGIQEKDIQQMSQNALKDLTALVNPRQGTVEDIIDLFKAAM
ncbi:iron-containing alcohol dehydrogenase [Clostridium formicaceticum]|uniref:Alcohol dehydrogenase 2 n=1 Tax=Clostridium formicaceticum TaxID=1497 RepID=A0AAC9RPC9_9CLOT|nr:iron-containing alcohol dehydrogenase [Clostridium formicaceticum]AOY77918.1 L-threonine dehydrogenase [Clostridium formicaceticum]ARE88538.1 Alcohol dehydrogenase 2 [Clostridium formicaceticum]